MNSLEENMEEILNVEVSDTPEGGCAKRKDQLRDVSEDRDKDYEYTRGELYSLIDQGQETDANAVANRVQMRGVEGGQPITDMTASQAISTITDQIFKTMNT